MSQFKDFTDKLEGPRIIRYLGAAAGAAMTILAVHSMWHIFKEFQHPNALLIKVYAAIAGLCIVCIELKSLDQLQQMREFALRWMPFLTVMAGKGTFYIFSGFLSLAFVQDFYMLVPGVILVSIGVTYLLVHFGQCNQLAEAFERHEQQRTALLSGNGGKPTF